MGKVFILLGLLLGGYILGYLTAEFKLPIWVPSLVLGVMGYFIRRITEYIQGG